MTDKERVIAFLESLGIGYSESEYCIECHEGMSKVVGHACFYTQFLFDENFALISVGAYE